MPTASFLFLPASTQTTSYRLSSRHDGTGTIATFPFPAYAGKVSSYRLSSQHDGTETIAAFPFPAYAAKVSSYRLSSQYDGTETIAVAAFPFPAYAAKVSSYRLSSQYDGTETIAVAAFPFPHVNTKPIIAAFPFPMGTKRRAAYRFSSRHDGTETIAAFPFPAYAAKVSSYRLSSRHDGTETITVAAFPFPYVNTKPIIAAFPFPMGTKRRAAYRLSNQYDGTETIAVAAFPFPMISKWNAAYRFSRDEAGSRVMFASYPFPPLTITVKIAAFPFPMGTKRRAVYRLSCDLTIASVDSGRQTKYPFPPYMSHRTIFTTNYSVLMRAGWRMMARDLATGMVSELGFIPALSEPALLESATTAAGRTLTGVELPEGEYEIFVLTSGMYWRDAMDRKIYTISVHPDQPEISPLPKINNLRVSKLADMTGSDVNLQEGETGFILEWNTTPLADLNDSGNDSNGLYFAFWYSPALTTGAGAPVDVNRAPDALVPYDENRTEYDTDFLLPPPCYVAAAAYRNAENSGEPPRLGEIQEIYLELTPVILKQPDDVVVVP
jgi:hypothetical protein